MPNENLKEMTHWSYEKEYWAKDTKQDKGDILFGNNDGYEN